MTRQMDSLQTDVDAVSASNRVGSFLASSGRHVHTVRLIER
jgi:hypothetical protein